jgi:acyl dehydratase
MSLGAGKSNRLLPTRFQVFEGARHFAHSGSIPAGGLFSGKATMQQSVKFRSAPSVAAYMLRALLPSPGLSRAGGFPPLRAVWQGYRACPQDVDAFLKLTGLSADSGLPLLYPQVAGFRLLMVLLTHPAFPLPIWRALQIRNHLLLHRPIPPDAKLEFESRVAGQRVLDKGAEVDLHTALRSRDGLLWESLNTFYYRGRFAGNGGGSPLAKAPEAGAREVAAWTTHRGVGWRFAGLTGDYNGIHWSNGYARVLGFPRAFHHPQLVLGQCLSRLIPAAQSQPQRLDAWIKGPVFYGREVGLRAEEQPSGVAFALNLKGDPRPALVGRWSRVAGDRERLLDAQDQPV